MKKRKNSPKSKIKAVIFDLGNVVIFYDYLIAARKISKITRISSKKISNIFKGNNSRFMELFCLGYNSKKYWKEAESVLGIKKLPLKKFNEILCTIFWPNWELIKMLPKLRTGYKLALISDTGKLHKKYLEEKYNLKKFFPSRIYSCDVKMMKSNNKIFKFTLKRLNLEPQEAVFIDDMIENIECARKVGIQSIFYRNNKQLFKQLEKRGIK